MDHKSCFLVMLKDKLVAISVLPRITSMGRSWSLLCTRGWHAFPGSLQTKGDNIQCLKADLNKTVGWKLNGHKFAPFYQYHVYLRKAVQLILIRIVFEKKPSSARQHYSYHYTHENTQCDVNVPPFWYYLYNVAWVAQESAADKNSRCQRACCWWMVWALHFEPRPLTKLLEAWSSIQANVWLYSCSPIQAEHELER